MWYLVVLEIGDKMVDLKLQFPEGFLMVKLDVDTI